MAEPTREDEGVMQEWTPLALLQQIPLKTQRGLFSKNLNLTCVDVVSEFIALGTNLGFLYWYCRATGDLQRLGMESHNCCVTCVKIMSFVDHMVAAGTNQGTVVVFQIPSIHIECTQNQIKAPKQKQIERFTVNGLHQASVTSIEWDSNEVKIFSGDKNGVVVLTEINLSLHISKSMELLNEQFEIVQLSYCQNILLISTVFRSIVCDGSNNWKVHQVGTKERKILGKFGATLCKFPQGLVLFASRPGHCLWLSDKNGAVQQTLIFKYAIQSNCSKIQLINPVDKKEPYDTSFGKIIQFGDNKLITYNSEVMYVLHPGAVSIVSVLNEARKILDVAVNENEIFILEGERSLLRISTLPDKYSLEIPHQPSCRKSFNLDEFAAKLKDTAVESIKKITKDFIPIDEKKSSNSPPPVADEALELPPLVTLPAGLMPSLLTGESTETHYLASNQNFKTSTESWPSKYNKEVPFANDDMKDFTMNSQDFHEEIISRPLRKRNIKKFKFFPQMQSGLILSESGSDTAISQNEDRLIRSVANDFHLSDESSFNESQPRFFVPRDLSSLQENPTSLQSPQKKTPKINEGESEETMKTADTKSLTSLDTCESVSECLFLTSEPLREVQEKPYPRLADHSLFDSYNSEKTDNMSISLIVTNSSSVSSKISENLPSPSCASENSGMGSKVKSFVSEDIDNFENELSSSSKGYRRLCSDFSKTDCSEEGNIESPSENFLSDRNSQREIYSKWEQNKESIIHGTFGTCEFSTNAFQDLVICNNDKVICHNIKSFNDNFYLPENFIVEPEKSRPTHSQGDTNLQATTELNSYRCLARNNDHCKFLIGKEIVNNEREMEDEPKKMREFPSDEPLSYGPPSGSSMLSSQPSSGLTSIPINQEISVPLTQDSLDHWPQYKTPEKITSLAVSRNYVICTDYKDRVYYSYLSGLGLSWKQLDYKASMVRVSGDGSAVWLLNKKTVSALVHPSLNSPISDSLEDIAQDIRTFATDSINKDGLLVTLTGEIINYNHVTKSLQSKEISCSHIISDVVCSGGVILALSNDRSVLCKLPEKDDFNIIKTTKPTNSLALGPGNLLWIIDEENNIFFSDDFISENPHWWQIHISEYIFQIPSGSFHNICSKMKLNELKASIQTKNSFIATNENSVWIYNKFDSTVFVNKTGFTGYTWDKVFSIKLLPSIQWQALCAGGVFENKGRVWLLSLDGNIFCTNPNYHYFQSVPVPCEGTILCMASSVDNLWVLSESGGFYTRLGLNNDNESGTSWREMKSPHIDNLRFVWISCGTDVAWACDIHGRTFISIGSPHLMSAQDPIWVEVEGRPKDVFFEKVFVGSGLYMVWAVDKNHNLYVREGIFPHYQVGTSWIYVCGIEVVDIAISGTYLWALTSSGKIYRRCGISESNFIGDYWRRIPGDLRVISSSSTDELWGISQENNIVRLGFKLKILQREKIVSDHKDSLSLKEDITWEIVK